MLESVREFFSISVESFGLLACRSEFRAFQKSVCRS